MLLEKLNLNYQEINIQTSPEKRDEMLTKSNGDDVKDIAELIGNSKRPAMIAPILYNPMKKNWAIL